MKNLQRLAELYQECIRGPVEYKFSGVDDMGDWVLTDQSPGEFALAFGDEYAELIAGVLNVFPELYEKAWRYDELS